MVTFTCQNCNSCLKKKAVETHLYKCKNPQLTCIDCLKDFDVKSYGGHVTCVTEDQRYGGQGFTPSSSMLKQTQWHQCVGTLLSSGRPLELELKSVLRYAFDFPTCPRNKKKFVNFILNNKMFSKARTLADNAYDLIFEEFNKSQSSETNENGVDSGTAESNKSAEQSSGKRKKISETDLQEDTITNGVSEKTTEKIARKKNKHNGENHQENGDLENKESGHKKNKKKNKHSNSNESNEPTTNGDAAVPDSASTKLKKKNKDKRRKNSTNREEEEQITNTCVTDEPCTNLHEDNDEEDIKEPTGADEAALGKLTKKERKKLLKMKKYQAEIESIENYKKTDEEDEEGEGESATVTADTAAALNGEKRKKKKKKHIEEEEVRQQKNSISEPDDKKIRLEEEDGEEEEEAVVTQRPKKFKWDEVIVEVLQAQGDGEMSLKRLSKKVCSEYASVLGEPKSWEEVLLKFNKKVIRTPGVRVLKDKAKLLTQV